MSILKDLLLQDGPEPGTTLDRYSLEVRQCFKNPGRLTLLNVDQLMQEPAFRQWEDSHKSSMILLQGRTAITSRDYSYLSPAIFHLVDQHQVQGHQVIFHCCHDRVFMDKDTPVHVVLSSLVFQLLNAKSSILRDQLRFEDLKRRFKDPAWRLASPKPGFVVLGKLLGLFTEIYIFLDRVDRIKGSPDRLLDPLANLVKTSRCKVKVFLTASTNHQDPEGKLTPDLLKDVQEELGSQRFSCLTFNQK